MQSLLCDIKPAESAGTKGVDGFYQEATIKEQAHKLSPALRAAERGASRVCSTDSASAGTKGNKHCSLIKNLCQNTGKADLATCGLSLVEVLVGAAIGAVVMLGTAKTLAVALQSSNIVRTIVTEQALKSSLTEALSGDDIGTKRDQKRENCAKNLAPNNLVGSHQDKGVGTINTLFKVLGDSDPPNGPDGSDLADEKLISKGSFRDNIEVVEMELLDPNPTASGPSDPKDEVGQDLGTTQVQRRLIVRYKKKNLGQLNTVGNKECSATDKSGCYFKICDVDYGLTSGADATDPNQSGANVVHTCHSYNCFQYGEWTASKKYCVLEDCFNGGCLQWSDKKPKEEDKRYSFVEPFGNVSWNALNRGEFNIYFEDKENHITIRTARTNPVVATKATKGCCTIKKFYINKALEAIRNQERSRRYSYPIGIYCKGFLHGPNSITTAIDNMLHPSINAKCPSDVPKSFLTFLNLPPIKDSNENRMTANYLIYKTSDKTCINVDQYHNIQSFRRNRVSIEADYNGENKTRYFLRKGNPNPGSVQVYFPYWDDLPSALTLP